MFLQEAHRHSRTTSCCCIAAWDEALLALAGFVRADVFAQALQAAVLAGTLLRPAIALQVGCHAAAGNDSCAASFLVGAVHLQQTCTNRAADTRQRWPCLA
jgi:hypothetical protein